MTSARADHVSSRMNTEFGVVMVTLVTAVAGARGAVLCDRDGEAIDFAQEHGAIDELDLQIAGAQCSRELVRIDFVARRRGIGHGCVMFEATSGCMLGAVVDFDAEMVLVMVLRARAHLGAALVQFERARVLLERLLGP